MKNISDETSDVNTSERLERAKKLYRYVSDIARRVGDSNLSSQTVCNLFSTHVEVQRQKIRDNCEKLFFLDPDNHGKKALELLWRKVYYETVTAAKKLRESESDDCDSYLFTHLVSGIGQFHHLIERIENELHVQFKALDYITLHTDEEVGSSEKVTDEIHQVGCSALHSCLIYLGDLCRYQSELFHMLDPSIAARYYLQATHVDLSSGMPYNQLGNLFLDKNHNLDSVCYYIHCLSCSEPFEGAMGNLTKIFEKIIHNPDQEIVEEQISQAEHIQNTVNNFLSLIEIWYMGRNDTNIPQRCNAIAHELKIAIDFTKIPLPDVNESYEKYLQANEEENINPSFLNSNLIHKMVQICLFTIAKMMETDETKAFACKAFTLALLSQLLQKLLQQLKSFGLANPAKAKIAPTVVSQSEGEEEDEIQRNELEVVTTNGNAIDDNQSVDGSGDDGKEDEDKNKKTLAKRRRRRRTAVSDSSDVSDEENDTSEMSDASNEDELSDSTYHSGDDTKSEESECENDSDTEKEDTIKEENDKVKTKLTNGDVKVNGQAKANKEKKDLNSNDIQNFLLGDNFLASIKLLQDWILTEKELIISCGDSGDSLFQCVVDLLNIFTFYFNPKNELFEDKDSKILHYARNVAKKLKLEYKTIPLPEDINLRGTHVCKYDKDASEWQILDKYKPSVYEENVIRILNFIDFGNQIAKIVPRIRYNRTSNIFYLKKLSQPKKVHTKINHKKTREWHNSKKQPVEPNESGLLRRLGRLWLVSQVRELERQSKPSGPVLLALDSSALDKHLRRVKQLLRAKNFILLIPTVVLQELDDLKRDSSGARDAIRWIEMQLKSGSRFLRAQRPNQSKPLPLLKYPRKAPINVLNFVQILEFCNHFIADEKQGGNGDPDNSLHGKSAPLLILLVGAEPAEEYKEFSLTGAAQSAGISIENIENFYTKWRQTVHKSGKKR